jgi:threonyl-tRNA synthetase
VEKKLKEQGIRITVDSQPNSLGKKIRNAEIAKVIH